MTERCKRCKAFDQRPQSETYFHEKTKFIVERHTPECAFRDEIGPYFLPDNHGCATMLQLRRRAEDLSLHKWTDSQQCYGMVPFGEGEGAICMSWYKDRLHTETACVLWEDGTFGPLELEVAERALADNPEEVGT